MRHRVILPSCVLVVLSGIATANATRAAAMPPFSEVRQTVLRYFQAQCRLSAQRSHHKRPGGTVLAQLQKKGFPLADAGKSWTRCPPTASSSSTN